MGALDAFSKAFSLVAENRGAYLLVLVVFLALAILNSALFPGIRGGAVPREEILPDVVFEKHGMTHESTDELVRYVEIRLLWILIVAIVLAFVEYSIVRTYFLSLDGKEYSISELIAEALPKIPVMIIVNILAYLTGILVALVPALVMIVGGLTLNPFLAFFGLVLVLLVIPILITYYPLVVATYVDTGNLGAFIEALGLVFRRLPSSLGYGLLTILLAFGVSIVMAPLVLPFTLSSEPSVLVISLLEAPFEAFFVCFLLAGGVLLYKEFKGIEEIEERTEEPVY